MKPIKLAFVRSSTRGLDCLVALAVTPACDALRSTEQALEAIKQAVTAWVSGTPEGRRLYESSSGEPNIGDVGDWLCDAAFKPFLAKAGIKKIEVLYWLSEREAVPYDTCLADVDFDE